MAAIKSTKSRQSGRADAGSFICNICGESVRNRGRKQHKCNGQTSTTSLSDVFKEIAEQEALERGVWRSSIQGPQIQFYSFNCIILERALLSIQKDQNDNNLGQSSQSESVI